MHAVADAWIVLLRSKRHSNDLSKIQVQVMIKSYLNACFDCTRFKLMIGDSVMTVYRHPGATLRLTQQAARS